MKIEVPFDIGDTLYIIRTTKSTGGRYIYIEKQIVKEIGKDDKGEYVNISGTRSKLSTFNDKYFVTLAEAKKKLQTMLQKYEYKERPAERYGYVYKNIIGCRYWIEEK